MTATFVNFEGRECLIFEATEPVDEGILQLAKLASENNPCTIQIEVNDKDDIYKFIIAKKQAGYDRPDGDVQEIRV